MAIDLTKIQPHKVSKDLSGYITFIYGKPKTGKTTLATQMPNSLLLAFEQGYNCLPGVMAADYFLGRNEASLSRFETSRSKSNV